MMKTVRASQFATAALVLGALVGCGGSDPAAETSPSESEPTAEATGDVDAFCDAFIALNKQGDDEISAEQGVDEIATLVDTAPPEVAADIKILDDSYQALIGAIEAAGFDVSVLDDGSALTQEQQTQIQTEAEANGFDAAKVGKARGNVETWAADNCEDFVPAQDEPAAPPSADNAGNLKAFCAAYKKLDGDISTADSLSQFESLAANAPAEVSADATTVRTSAVAYIDALAAVGLDPSALQNTADLSKRETDVVRKALESAGVDEAAYTQAATNVETFAGKNC